MSWVKPDGYAYYIPFDTRVPENVAFVIDAEGAWRLYRIGGELLALRPMDVIQLNHMHMPTLNGRALFPGDDLEGALDD